MNKHDQRGMLNTSSTASVSNWSWDDFSEAIGYLAKEYAATTPLRDLRADRTSRFQVACEVAEIECALNARFHPTSWGGNDALFHHLTNPGSRYLDRVIIGIIECTLLEAETGYPCKPNLISVSGLDDMVYPIILPIIKDRSRQFTQPS
ncbi:hypothetical protein [Marinobacter sp. tcs-11]|uniref:hypothetical protein n=1 Tax=Marinobacter sp. tcs-11 TaxID=1742860 RepID=UPI00257E84B5|nr:hypothetical protein [Marinobacter sp. tcs-11]